nr:hypothetical protein [Tanacetum cinerariifolium]GFB84125.1 hypothetical protein [Tanacetum cinerariifolium]
MKVYPKHIDWGKVIATNEIMDGDEEEEAKVAKASEDMKLSIMKEKFLAMVESEKDRVKDYTKLVVCNSWCSSSCCYRSGDFASRNRAVCFCKGVECPCRYSKYCGYFWNADSFTYN